MQRPPVHPAALPPEQLLSQCDMQCLRRGGPGGQRRNKVETAVLLCHRPTGVKAEANERRNRAENRSIALFRLRMNLALQVRHLRQSADVPSAVWRSRVSGGRITISDSHGDLPAVLAEALDVIAACEADVKSAAARLHCTTSQLVKLLKKQPRAVKLVSTWRQRGNLH